MFNEKEYMKKYRIKNKEKLREYGEQYYKDNKEILLERSKQWVKDNPEKCKKISKRYYEKNHKELIERARRWTKDHPEKLKEKNLSRYNLSYEDWVKMWVSQDGECAICKEPFAKQSEAHVDHNHETGKIRGLLCVKCNSALGFLNDNPKLTAKATKYLLGSDLP